MAGDFKEQPRHSLDVGSCDDAAWTILENGNTACADHAPRTPETGAELTLVQSSPHWAERTCPVASAVWSSSPARRTCAWQGTGPTRFVVVDFAPRTSGAKVYARTKLAVGMHECQEFTRFIRANARLALIGSYCSKLYARIVDVTVLSSGLVFARAYRNGIEYR
jgi:hypothetical protein